MNNKIKLIIFLYGAVFGMLGEYLHRVKFSWYVVVIMILIVFQFVWYLFYEPQNKK